MEKRVEPWSVRELWDNFSRIDFPEYQREPNLWPLVEKQRLIDSMVRRFDIASLYFYRHDDGSIDCVDGRQRIGSIMSIARTYGPVVARVIEPPCGPVDGLLSPLGLRVKHLLSVEQGPVG